MANSILAKMAVQISANTAEFGKGIKQAESSLKSFQSTVTQVGTALGVTFGVKEIASFVLEANKLAGTFEGVKRAFDRLPESVRLMNTLKEATHGTVGELELMQQALRARNFGINVKDLATYLEFAAIRAQQTGESIDYMVNSIILGLGRGSIKILDNLQVNIVKIKETVKETGVTLQEAFRQQVVEQMKTIGGYAETSATAVDKLSSAFKDLKLALSQAVENKEAIGFFEQITKDLSDIVRAQFTESGGAVGPLQFLKNLEAINQRREDLNAATKRADAIIKEENGSVQKRIDYIQQEINTITQLIGVRNDEIRNSKSRLTAIASEIKALEQKNKSLSGFQKQFTEEAKRIDKLKEERDVILGMLPALETNKRVIGETQKLLKERIKAIEQEDDATKKLVAANGTIRFIEQELGLLRESQLDLKGKELAETNREIQLLEEKLKKLREIGTVTKEQLEAQQKARLLAAFKFTPPKGVDTGAVDFGDKNPYFSFPIINQIQTAVVPALTAFQDAYAQMVERIKAMNEQMRASFEGLVEGAIFDFADALGGLAAGGKAGDFGKQLLASVAGFSQQFGALLIANGVALKAFNTFKNPAAMIAAGAALVAIGGAIRQTIASRPGGSGGGSGSSVTPVRTQAGEFRDEIILRARGSDLIGVLSNAGFDNANRKV